MNVGVVGNPSYRDLNNILAHLAQVAPRLGLTLFTEDQIAGLWPEPAPAPLHSAPQLECLITLGGDGMQAISCPSTCACTPPHSTRASPRSTGRTARPTGTR